MGNKARKTYSSHKELQCKQWIMKLGRLIVHTRSYKCKQWVMKEDLHKDLQCKKWVIKQGRLILHTRSYNANNG
ncbi:hypothetical protein KSS87_019331 [Heliosperma pusillum]|nr:hypothetical protein KSS87_019331 [Heliosperma pusillum]